MVMWMNGVLPMSSQKTLKGETRSICLRESLDGNLPCSLRGGQQTGLFGQPVVHVNRSHAPESKKPGMINATCGPKSYDSSASYILARSLANKYRELSAGAGSMLFCLTLKRKATPAGRLYFQLAASGRRTLGKESTGWPTPRSEDSEQTGAHRGNLDTLNSASKAAQWATPTGRDGRDGRASEATMQRNARPLNEQVVAWATPNAHDGRRPGVDLSSTQHGNLNRDAVLFAPWQTPCAMMSSSGRKQSGKPNLQGEAGLTQPGSPAGTEKAAKCRLNPLFSLWLMGFPVQEWASCAPLATRLSRRSPRNS
jgi:hypothetical protein